MNLRSKICPTVCLAIVLMGGVFGVRSQTRQSDSHFLPQRVTGLELSVSKSDDKLGDLLVRVVRLETQITDIEKSVSGVWNIQLGILAAVVLSIIQRFFEKRRRSDEDED